MKIKTFAKLEQNRLIIAALEQAAAIIRETWQPMMSKLLRRTEAERRRRSLRVVRTFSNVQRRPRARPYCREVAH